MTEQKKRARKYQDFIKNRSQGHDENKVRAAFKGIANSSAGAVILDYFILKSMQNAPLGETEGAWREIEAERRMARRIVNMMIEETNDDGS